MNGFVRGQFYWRSQWSIISFARFAAFSFPIVRYRVLDEQPVFVFLILRTSRIFLANNYKVRGYARNSALSAVPGISYTIRRLLRVSVVVGKGFRAIRRRAIREQTRTFQPSTIKSARSRYRWNVCTVDQQGINVPIIAQP